MSEHRVLHCPDGHEIVVEMLVQYVDGEKSTEVVAHSSHPTCELCQDIILVLRQDPDALEGAS